jgi:hypothetical protein
MLRSCENCETMGRRPEQAAGQEPCSPMFQQRFGGEHYLHLQARKWTVRSSWKADIVVGRQCLSLWLYCCSSCSDPESGGRVFHEMSMNFWILTRHIPEANKRKVKLKNGVFWDVTPCGSCKNRRFGGT